MNKWIFVFCVLVMLQACTKSSKRETPTEGSIKVAADPAVSKMSGQIVDAFTHIYGYANVEFQEMRAADAINALLDDSVRVIIIPGTLTLEQIDALKKKNIYPTIQPVAKDAIAVIIHPDNPDSMLRIDVLKAIADGSITNWNQLNPKQTSREIEIVIDQAGASVAMYLQDSLLQGKALASGIHTIGSNQDVIHYVSQNIHAIGFVGVNWICNSNDSMAIGFLQQVRPVHLKNEQDGSYYLPFQAWIGQELYPLRRTVNAISLETRSGLGTGFISFAAGDKGQRVVLKSGLMPATKPVRQVRLQ